MCHRCLGMLLAFLSVNELLSAATRFTSRIVAPASGIVKMPALIGLTAVIQAFFVLHVFRTRRPYWWAVIITATPVVGCVAYYLIEIFPRSRELRTAQRMSVQLATAFVPHSELRRRLADLQLCPSVANKVAAAEELMRCGMYYRAICLYEEALRGIYATDPQLLMGLARAHVNNQTCEQAREVLERLSRIDARYRPEEVRLLNARALEGLSRFDEAAHEYQQLCEVYVGLEAKCRYGLLLKHLRRYEDANQVFSEVLAYASRFNLRVDTEQVWIDTARRSIAQAA